MVQYSILRTILQKLFPRNYITCPISLLNSAAHCYHLKSRWHFPQSITTEPIARPSRRLTFYGRRFKCHQKKMMTDATKEMQRFDGSFLSKARPCSSNKAVVAEWGRTSKSWVAELESSFSRSTGSLIVWCSSRQAEHTEPNREINSDLNVCISRLPNVQNQLRETILKCFYLTNRNAGFGGFSPKKKEEPQLFG